MVIEELPFIEEGNTQEGFIRTFKSDLEADELKWHWDEQDRQVTPIHDTDWLFQFDDQRPLPLVKDVTIFIKAGTWHRLHKGTGDLRLFVIKYEVPVRSNL